MKLKTHYTLILLGILSIFMLTISCTTGQKGKQKSKDGLEHSTPEAEGIPSEAILNYLKVIEDKGIELHSFMLLRHGKVVAEGWWDPFQRDTRHIMYSVSKTILSTAVGFAIKENRLSLHDKVTSFFPDYKYYSSFAS